MISTILIGILAIVVPGFFLALALLKRTGMNLLEIFLIGIFFGIIFPPAMVWLESYLISYIHAFSFSAGLYNIDVIILTIIGIALSYWQGAFTMDMLPSSLRKKEALTRTEISADYKQRISELRVRISHIGADMRIIREHEKEEIELARSHAEELRILKDRSAGAEETESVRRQHGSQERRLYEEHEREERGLISSEDTKQKGKFPIAWLLLLLLMLIAFTSRLANIGAAPHFFEFDPYFDMIAAQQILTYGYQLFTTHAAWPTLINGTIQRIQPAVPYLEAYWYQIANPVSGASINLTSLSTVSSVYPPLLAALLVFVVFMFVYHIYGDFAAIIAAGLAAAMPTLITTYIAGEQLLEPWGITALFFFFAAYLLAVKNPREKRYAILAGIAFISNFLGAHYYTVSAGILALYILFQAVINAIRDKNDMDFYKMNAVVILVIIIGYIAYAPYNAVYGGGVPTFLKIPTIVAYPLFALILGFIIGLLTDTIDSGMIPKSISSVSKKVMPIFTNQPALSLAVSAIGLLLIVLGLIALPLVILPGLLIVSIFGLIAVLLGFASGGWGSVSKHRAAYSRLAVIVLIGIILVLAVMLTPIGNSVKKYLDLSVRFTTPSSPLFMTVQEYAQTGLTYNFGSSGFFGIIAASVGGFPLVLWIVLIAFAAIEGYQIALKGSNTAVVSIWILAGLAAAGMSEVKYLPHFGVAYIIAFAIVIAEIALYIKRSGASINWSYALYIISAAIVVIEAFSLVQVFSAAAAFSGLSTNSTAYAQQCNALASGNYTNALGATMYCNQVPGAWLAATAWMAQNIGPLGPRILSWWDYGDWINWFGNSNAAIRGDNAVASFDYAVAAQYVLGINSSFGPSSLAHFMNQDTTQAQYVLFDDQLVPKWSALDFLGCVNQSQTSQSFAESQGTKYGVNFVIGTSQCELNHDPVYINIPEQPTISDYCNFSNSSVTAVHALLTTGETIPQLVNQTYCVATTPRNNSSVLNVYYSNGTKANVLVGLNSEFYKGGVQFTQNGPAYLQFMAVYLPNGPNATITNAPTYFYNSNYYRGFFLGKLSNAFTLAYPSSFNGINYINFTAPVVIFKLNNYTASLPAHTPKPGWVSNNYTIPG